MTIAKYINDLLYRYDCVIVPNFGGFITNRIGAKVNPFTNNFYPPTKQISLNAHLKQNDGLLVNYIASVENISFAKPSIFLRRLAFALVMFSLFPVSYVLLSCSYGSIGNLESMGSQTSSSESRPGSLIANSTCELLPCLVETFFAY